MKTGKSTFHQPGSRLRLSELSKQFNWQTIGTLKQTYDSWFWTFFTVGQKTQPLIFNTETVNIILKKSFQSVPGGKYSFPIPSFKSLADVTQAHKAKMRGTRLQIFCSPFLSTLNMNEKFAKFVRYSLANFIYGYLFLTPKFSDILQSVAKLGKNMSQQV